MTDEATAALGGGDRVVVTTFPFRIGREARTTALARAVASVERRLGTAPQANDLYLIERASSPEAYQISRRHCDIEHEAGRFFLLDRASATGSTILKPHARGGSSGRVEAQAGGSGFQARSELHDGDFIVLGTRNSPYVFRFQIESASMPDFTNRSVVVIDADFFSHDD